MPLEEIMPRYARIYQTLQDRIRRGSYPAGSRLPAQQELAIEFGVNIGTLRHAIDLLAREGMLQTRPGIGTIVSDPPATSSRPKVVVCDDDAEYRQLLREVVEGDGYEVLEAADGLQAVEQARDSNVGIIFLDLRMPRMNGVEARKKLAESTSKAVVIMVTAYPDDLREVLDYQTWPLLVIRKPATPQQVRDALRMGQLAWDARATR